MHATAVAIGSGALLIRGPSGAGKSRLALDLIAASTPQQPIRLIGDDRVIVSTRSGRVTAHAHPRIAGFIERRGLGIVATPFVDEAPVCGIVDLAMHGAIAVTNSTKTLIAKANFPTLIIVSSIAQAGRRDWVLHWWRGLQ